MTTHNLDLFENAIDSLIEALKKFEEGDAGEPAAYKFAVLHMAHFVELLFKHHITDKHPLLIFKDPFAQKLNEQKTITLWDAVNFINNEAADTISTSLRKDLEWLKNLRNNIEHHRFSMEVSEVRITLGRLFRSVREFIQEHSDVDLEDHIPQSVLRTFQLLSDEYEFKLRTAIQEADRFENDHPPDHNDPDALPPRIACEACGEPTMILNESSSTGYKCLMCENEEGDEIPAGCTICGAMFTYGELQEWRDEHGIEYRCYYCSGQYAADKDKT